MGDDNERSAPASQHTTPSDRRNSIATVAAAKSPAPHIVVANHVRLVDESPEVLPLPVPTHAAGSHGRQLGRQLLILSEASQSNARAVREYDAGVRICRVNKRCSTTTLTSASFLFKNFMLLLIPRYPKKLPTLQTDHLVKRKRSRTSIFPKSREYDP